MHSNFKVISMLFPCIFTLFIIQIFFESSNLMSFYNTHDTFYLNISLWNLKEHVIWELNWIFHWNQRSSLNSFELLTAQIYKTYTFFCLNLLIWYFSRKSFVITLFFKCKQIKHILTNMHEKKTWVIIIEQKNLINVLNTSLQKINKRGPIFFK